MTEVVDIVFRRKGDTKVIKSIDRISDRSQRASSTVGFLQRGIALLGTGVAVRGLINLADSFSLVESRIALVTKSTEELTLVQKGLFDISQSTRSSMDATAELYSRIARNADDLKLSQSELLGVTKSINQAIQISGVEASAANAAIVQLGQGLASGELRGDELRSVLEQVPRLASAIADGMGVTIGELRELGKQGSITADAVIQAIRSQTPELEEEFKKVPITVGAAFTTLRNSAQLFIGRANKATEATGFLTKGIMSLADFLASQSTFDEIASTFHLWSLTMDDMSSSTSSISNELQLLSDVGGSAVDFIVDAFIKMPSNIMTAVKLVTVEVTAFFSTLITKGFIAGNKVDSAILGAFASIEAGAKIAMIKVGTEIETLAIKALKVANTIQGVAATALGDDRQADAMIQANLLLDERTRKLQENKVAAIDAINSEKEARHASFVERDEQLKNTLAAQKEARESIIDDILAEDTARNQAFEADRERRKIKREEEEAKRIEIDSGSGVNTVIVEDELSAEEKKNQRKLEQQQRFNELRMLMLEESTLNEREMEEVEFERKMAFLENFNNGEVKLLKDKQTLMKQLEIQHQAKMGNIHAKAILQRQKFEKMTTTEQVSFIAGSLKQITANAATENKKAFKIQKAAAITEAVINGIRGVQQAIGAYPPPINFVMAALVGAAAAVNISKIKSQKFGGGGSVGNISSGGGVGGDIGSTPKLEIPQPTQQVQDPESGGGTSSVQIIINGAITSEMIDELVIPRIQDATNNRNIVLFERNSRQAIEINEAA